MKVGLPWFLDLGTGHLLRKRVQVELLGPGPSTQRFGIVGLNYRRLPLSISEIAEITGHSWDHVDVMMLHTLAVAERTISLLERTTGLTSRWAWERPSELLLFTHSNKVPHLPSENASYGLYVRALGAVYFDYVDNQPMLSACLAHDAVAHEVCHAFLDGVKGWYDCSVETRALTECLGDIIAMVSAARLIETRKRVLEETKGELSGNPNVLSRFAELPNYAKVLRDISQPITRSKVELEFPTNSKERTYALAKVLSSALYEAMCRTFKEIATESQKENHLLEVVNELAETTFGCLDTLPRNKVSFSVFIQSCLNKAGKTLGQHLKDCFDEFELLNWR